jgi:molybdate transport system substrate-binding protein
MCKLAPLLLLIFILLGDWLQAVELKVAVAANFQIPAETIKKLFEAEYPYKIILIAGSSGKHFAQITNGAPFDIFFSADPSYINKLEELKLTDEGSRSQYAKGRLALVFAANKNFESEKLKKLHIENKLFTPEEFKKLVFTHLAIANPDLAPYGRAAKETLEKIGNYQTIKNRLVIGENIQQTQQFMISGNAELGFLSLAQVVSRGEFYLLVPENLYSPIVQEVVILRSPKGKPNFESPKRSANKSEKGKGEIVKSGVFDKNMSDVEKNKAARVFIGYLNSEKIKKLIQSYGYETR